MNSIETIRRRVSPAVVGLTVAGALVMFSLPADAQTRSPDTGDYMFRTYCAACHGAGAKGDGPLASAMKRRPANLTEIAKRNKGVFPRDLVLRIIDGREPVKGHGGPDMPVWGDVFTLATGGSDPSIVRMRLEALVTYLEGIQAKSTF